MWRKFSLKPRKYHSFFMFETLALSIPEAKAAPEAKVGISTKNN
jgi:hypothetical protein